MHHLKINMLFKRLFKREKIKEEDFINEKDIINIPKYNFGDIISFDDLEYVYLYNILTDAYVTFKSFDKRYFGELKIDITKTKYVDSLSNEKINKLKTITRR